MAKVCLKSVVTCGSVTVKSSFKKVKMLLSKNESIELRVYDGDKDWFFFQPGKKYKLTFSEIE